MLRSAQPAATRRGMVFDSLWDCLFGGRGLAALCVMWSACEGD